MPGVCGGVALPVRETLTFAGVLLYGRPRCGKSACRPRAAGVCRVDASRISAAATDHVGNLRAEQSQRGMGGAKCAPRRVTARRRGGGPRRRRAGPLRGALGGGGGAQAGRGGAGGAHRRGGGAPAAGRGRAARGGRGGGRRRGRASGALRGRGGPAAGRKGARGAVLRAGARAGRDGAAARARPRASAAPLQNALWPGGHLRLGPQTAPRDAPAADRKRPAATLPWPQA